MDYDKMRRQISQSIGEKTTRTTYDTLGNILSVDDGTTVIEYVYDVNANIVLERLGDDSVSYAYNADGTRRFIGRANPGFYMKYKLPAELTSDENTSQKEIAKKRQGDPSTLR